MSKPMEFMVYLKSGNSFSFKAVDLAWTPNTLQWTSAPDQWASKLITVEREAIEAIVRVR